MSLVSAAQNLPGRRSARASITSHLPHWSEVEPDAPRPRPAPMVDPDAPRPRPAPMVAAVLRDLVSWGADIAILLTRGCPEDREAIERVRCAAYAWLANEPLPDVAIDDVLTTVAAIMSGIDRDLNATVPGDEDDERCAIGAAVPA